VSLTAINNASLSAFNAPRAKNSAGNTAGSNPFDLSQLGLGNLDMSGLLGSPGGAGGIPGMSSLMSGDTAQLFGFLQTSMAPIGTMINDLLTGIQNGSISSKAPEGAETGSTAPALPTDASTTSGSSSSGSSAGSVGNAQFDKNWDPDLSKIPAGEREAFKAKVLKIANNLEMDPDHLMAIMKVESGFDASIRNGLGSGATGLIQFMPDTARGLGTTTDALANMSAVEQLDYVEKYLMPYKGKMKTAADAYMAVFSPAFIGKGDDNVAYSSGSSGYNMNQGLDLNKDGKITNGELGTKITDAMA